jgi:integrase
MARAKARGGWSYSAGERGRNRVRVFDRPDRDGEILLQYAERDVTGRLRQVRKSLGSVSRVTAKTEADRLAAQFATLGSSTAQAPLTLKSLFDIYERSVSPEKGESKRKHDARCAAMFIREFGAGRDPRSLSRAEWDRFVAGRRRGTIGPVGAKRNRGVRDRVIAYDLKHLQAVLNWACTMGDGHGSVLMDRNPLKGFPIPSESSPRRPVIVAEQYDELRKAARAIGPAVELLLTLVYETGHRVGSVRQLRWSDVDFDGKRLTWRGEYDKLGCEHVTALSDVAITALAAARRRGKVIGDTWVFRQAKNDKKPWSRHYVRDLWDRLAKRTKLPTTQRYGWHAFRRTFATEFKHISLKDLCEMGGWKSAHTVLTCYQRGDEATQRTALTQRKTLRASGLSG